MISKNLEIVFPRLFAAFRRGRIHGAEKDQTPIQKGVVYVPVVMQLEVLECGASCFHNGDSYNLRGDVNGDGEVDGRDLLRLAKYVAGVI